MPNYRRTIALFIQIRRAEWAADIEGCQRLIAAYERETTLFGQRGFSPLNALSETVRLIKEGFEGINDNNYSKRFIVLETRYLRGVLNRLGERNFLLRAYITDAEIEDSFYEKADEVAGRFEDRARKPVTQERSDDAQLTFPEILFGEQFQFEEDAVTRPSWTEVTNTMMFEASIGDFGLIQIKGTWLGASAEQTKDEIINLFYERLSQVEPQPSNDNVRR